MAVEARIPTLTVLVKGPESSWSAIGGDPLAQGITVEGLTCSVNESGPDTCAFTLRRRGDVPYPDIAAFAAVEVWVGGAIVWGGRVWEAPLSDTGDDAIAVSCRGWQYHLDDDVVDRGWVHTDLAAWKSVRGFPGVDLNKWHVGGEPNAGQGTITLGWPYGSTVQNATGSGVQFDAGANRVIKNVELDLSAFSPTTAYGFYVRGYNSVDPLTGVGYLDFYSAVMNVVPTNPTTTPSATGFRYVSVFLYRQDGLTAATGADHAMRINAIKLFAEQSRDESGGASILKASDVVKDILASGALPQLNPDTGKIVASSFSIPDYWPDGYRTPREILAAVNAYENRLLGVDATGRLFFRARSTVPTVEVGAWAGSSFTDASTNTGDALYNRVIVQATGPDGTPVSVPVISGITYLGRFGGSLRRTALFNPAAAVTATAAGQIGVLWLAEKERPPMKGTASIAGPSGARNVSGGPVQSVRMLLEVGNVMRISHLIDPLTGALGRDATIRSVSYDHASDTATVELDNERGRLETLLERLAVVTTQVLR